MCIELFIQNILLTRCGVFQNNLQKQITKTKKELEDTLSKKQADWDKEKREIMERHKKERQEIENGKVLMYGFVYNIS